MDGTLEDLGIFTDDTTMKRTQVVELLYTIYMDLESNCC